MSSPRQGRCIPLYSGGWFWPLDPRAEDMRIGDVAHSLSQLCRFTGQTDDLYSVAQHAVMVSRLVPAADALWGLLHDAAEAWLNDVARPVKLLLRDYGPIEMAVLGVVAAKWRLVWPIPPSVVAADVVALATEARDCFTPPRCLDDCRGIEPCVERIEVWPPKQAEVEFMRRYWDLLARRDGTPSTDGLAVWRQVNE